MTISLRESPLEPQRRKERKDNAKVFFRVGARDVHAGAHKNRFHLLLSA
jgi:hypothetical protein